MSDDYLKIIPADPHHVPPAECHARAVAYIEKLFPQGEECAADVYDAVQFIDQGENLEAVICPACGARTKIDFFSDRDAGLQWWYELGEEIEQTSAESIVTAIPCCHTSVRLVDLEFDWPAGFARFEVSIRNPNVAENLSVEQLAELEAVLGCKLRQVRAHY